MPSWKWYREVAAVIYNGGLECMFSKLLPCVVACKPDSPLVCGAVVVVVLNSVKKRGHSNHPTKQVNRVGDAMDFIKKQNLQYRSHVLT